MSKPPIKMIARHKRARHDYEIIATFEAGLSLLGSEVKSLRQGKATIAEAYIRIKDLEATLVGANIPPYSHATHENHEPDRPRPLLLKKSELRRLHRSIKQKGLTIVPLAIYFKGPWVKLEIALGRGKKLHDKRQTLKQKADRRDMRR